MTSPRGIVPGRRGSLSPWQRDLRFGVLALALPALVLFGLLIVAVLRSQQFRAFDQMLSQAIRASTSNTVLIDLARVLTWFGSWQGMTLVTTIAVIALLIFGRWRGAIYVVASIVPGWLIGAGVKTLVDRVRPEGALVPLPRDASFPSGHSLASFLLYGSLAVLAFTWIETAWLRRTLIALAAAVIIAVGLSRVVLGVHFTGDVLGSWLLGLAWLAFTSGVYLALVGPREGRRR